MPDSVEREELRVRYALADVRCLGVVDGACVITGVSARATKGGRMVRTVERAVKDEDWQRRRDRRKLFPYIVPGNLRARVWSEEARRVSGLANSRLRLDSLQSGPCASQRRSMTQGERGNARTVRAGRRLSTLSLTRRSKISLFCQRDSLVSFVVLSRVLSPRRTLGSCTNLGS